MKRAVKAGRWLGYVDPGRIGGSAQRPAGGAGASSRPAPFTATGLGMGEISETTVPEPGILLAGFRGIQPYKLVLFGEKVSLAPVLDPIADQYEADLFLPTGEISDTLLHRMARSGRRTVAR